MNCLQLSDDANLLLVGTQTGDVSILVLVATQNQQLDIMTQLCHTLIWLYGYTPPICQDQFMFNTRRFTRFQLEVCPHMSRPKFDLPAG